MATNTTPYTNITSVGTGTSGSTLSYANGSVAWTQPYNLTATMVIASDGSKVTIDEKAALEVKGKMVINGLDLEERLKTIERLMLIPERDAKMEAKYPSLKKKYDAYIKDLEKYRMWDSIKGEE